MLNDAFEILQQPRIQARIEALKAVNDEEQQLFLIKKLFQVIQDSSKSIVDEIGDGISITNLDEVTTALHNETTRNAKLLIAALKDLKLSGEKQTNILSAVVKDAQGRFESEFQTIRIRRPLDKVTVLNPEDFPKTESVEVTNHPDLKPFFDSLEKKMSETFNINLPAPQVHVEAPVIHVPETTVNVPELDLQPIVSEVKDGLKKIRTNNKSNPIFVRLTDLQFLIDKLEQVNQNTKNIAAFGGGPNQIFIKDVNGQIITPMADIGDTLKAFANISASTTDGAIVTGVVGRKIRVVAAIWVSAATATNVTFNSKPAGAGSAITCLFADGANGGVVGNFNPKGWFDTNVGEGLTATTGSGSTTGFLVNYILV
jgi:hypothetical protein